MRIAVAGQTDTSTPLRTEEGTVRVRFLTLTVAAVVLVARVAFAQEAFLIGVVSDETKGALPGVTVTATLVDTGRVITAVSDERGEYRLRGLPAGRYTAPGRAVGVLDGHHRRTSSCSSARTAPCRSP